METILSIQNTLKKIYGRNYRYINIAVKFLFALIAFGAIGNSLNGFKLLTNPVIILIAAVVCAVIPVNFIIIFSTGLILAHLFKINLIATVIVAAILLVLLILYFRFTPKLAYVVLITPLAFALKIPFAIPVVLGIVAAPYTCVATTCGTVVYFLLHNVSKYSGMLTNKDEETMTQLSTFVSKVLGNKDMIFYIIAFIIVIMVTYGVRSMPFNYSREAGIAVGTIASFILTAFASAALKADVTVASSAIGILLGAVIAYVGKVFVFSVDYKKTKEVQFEDDEYYYYVKAIPKISVDKKNDDYEDEEDTSRDTQNAEL